MEQEADCTFQHSHFKINFCIYHGSHNSHIAPRELLTQKNKGIDMVSIVATSLINFEFCADSSSGAGISPLSAFEFHWLSEHNDLARLRLIITLTE